MTAAVTIQTDRDLVSIAADAGQPDITKVLYRYGKLEVDGVTQAALDAAVARYNHAAIMAQKQAQAESAAAQAKLAQIDAASIRAIREWIVAQPNPPAALVARDNEAAAERAKLR